jgi:uncharacterized coiled-coil protein SlyX
MTEQHKTEGWHVERSVPIAVLTCLIANTAVLGWVASKYDSRISTIETTYANQTKHEEYVDSELAMLRSSMEQLHSQMDLILKLKGVLTK